MEKYSKDYWTPEQQEKHRITLDIIKNYLQALGKTIDYKLRIDSFSFVYKKDSGICTIILLDLAGYTHFIEDILSRKQLRELLQQIEENDGLSAPELKHFITEVGHDPWAEPLFEPIKQATRTSYMQTIDPWRWHIEDDF